MKHTKKILSILLVAALLLTYASAALAFEIDLGGTITTGGLNDLNVRQAARDYMDTRAAYLLGETETMEWVVTGIADDEAVHKKTLVEKCAVLNDMSYEIIFAECGDTEAVVVVNERVNYVMNGVAGSEIVEHDLYVMLYDDTTPFVAADGYLEDFSGFESSSYVAPNSGYETDAIGDDGGSASCILKIAKGEIGKGVDENGNTKYGEMFNTPKVKWCAAFICWCAEDANIATTKEDDTAVIYRSTDCDELLKFHKRKGTYFESEAFGGNEFPKAGDIMFIGYKKADGTLDSTHVALIEKVVGDTIHYINGNSSDGTVKPLTRDIAGTDILGYGRPAYENNGHITENYNIDGHNHGGICMNCNAAFDESHEYRYDYINNDYHRPVCIECMYLGSIFVHNFVDNCDGATHWQECVECGYKKNVEAHTCTTYTKNLSEHWKVCNDCGVTYEKGLHLYQTLADGRKKCKTCGYTIGGIEGGTIMSASDCGE